MLSKNSENSTSYDIFFINLGGTPKGRGGHRVLKRLFMDQDLVKRRVLQYKFIWRNVVYFANSAGNHRSIDQSDVCITF